MVEAVRHFVAVDVVVGVVLEGIVKELLRGVVVVLHGEALEVLAVVDDGVDCEECVWFRPFPAMTEDLWLLCSDFRFQSLELFRTVIQNWTCHRCDRQSHSLTSSWHWRRRRSC